MRMIKKKEKPMVRDFRPIALIELSCKLYFSFLKNEMEDHLERNFIVEDKQIGFTVGGRVEFNHFMLQYAVEWTYLIRRREKDMLIVVALDFKKAFNCVDHKVLLRKMSLYGVRGVSYSWFESYLTERYLLVEINGTRSESILVKIV